MGARVITPGMDWYCFCAHHLDASIGEYQAYFAPVQKIIPARAPNFSVMVSPLNGGILALPAALKIWREDWTAIFAPTAFRSRNVWRASRLRHPCGPTP